MNENLEYVSSLVVPLYKSAGDLDRLLNRLAQINEQIDGQFEVIFVIDGSPDDSWSLLVDQYKTLPYRTVLVRLSRNFGAIAATRQGIRHASGGAIAVMAADCQEPASLILDLFSAVRGGKHEIAVGVRVGRSDPALTRITSSIFWRVFRLMRGGSIPKRGVDVFAFSRKVSEIVGGLRESSTSLVGLLYWIGFEILEIEYVREERIQGKSSWSLNKRIRYAIDSLTTFSDAPIAILIGGGFLGSMVSFFYGILVILRQVIWSHEPRGYVPIFVGLLFITSILLIGLGTLGMYIWRIAENVRGRPESIVWTTITNRTSCSEQQS